MRKFFLVFCTVLLTACGKPDVQSIDTSEQSWVLADGQSHLTFISIKKGDIAEVHSFEGLTGRMDKDGHAKVEIVLDTVETNIDVRNTRMREHLFETGLYPFASIKSDIPIADLRALKVGDRSVIDAVLEVDLHGISSSIEGELTVTRVGDNKVLVETRTPILVHADEFDLTEGLDILQELANLPSITPIVPVSFSLVFEVKN